MLGFCKGMNATGPVGLGAGSLGGHALLYYTGIRLSSPKPRARVAFERGSPAAGGFTHPELTASATAPMAAELKEAGHTIGLTSNLPCGIGMARACGFEFRNILAVLEEVTE